MRPVLLQLPAENEVFSGANIHQDITQIKEKYPLWSIVMNDSFLECIRTYRSPHAVCAWRRGNKQFILCPKPSTLSIKSSTISLVFKAPNHSKTSLFLGYVSMSVFISDHDIARQHTHLSPLAVFDKFSWGASKTRGGTAGQSEEFRLSRAFRRQMTHTDNTERLSQTANHDWEMPWPCSP